METTYSNVTAFNRHRRVAAERAKAEAEAEAKTEEAKKHKKKAEASKATPPKSGGDSA